MKKIPISDIENGMVLAKPLIRPDGKILMAAGVALKANMGHRLQNWGINVAYIEDEEGDASQAEKIKEKIERLDQVFEGTLENELMKKLYDGVKEHFEASLR